MFVITPRWGWHVINISFPRAMPWAITFGAFGAEERSSDVHTRGDPITISEVIP